MHPRQSLALSPKPLPLPLRFLWEFLPSDTNAPVLCLCSGFKTPERDDYDDKMIPPARWPEQSPSQIFVSHRQACDMLVTQNAAPLGRRVPSKHVSCHCLTDPRRSLLYARHI